MFTSKEGQTVPKVTFRTRREDRWQYLSSDDLFRGKNVIVFSLPGAFTPTCSSSHLPRYNELFPVFQNYGIDAIYCISVNDTFVMNAWKADLDAENIQVIPDGNGEFTEAMGLLVDKSDLGFGKRSWRYSMLVKNSVIEKMFIEPDEPGDPFKVSDADTILKHIAPSHKAQESIVVFTRPGCSYCTKAKATLSERGLEYEEIVLGKDASIVGLRAITQGTTTPQIFIGGKLIGGSEELDVHLN
ncbi:glutathione peroxidase [Candidatus Haliotispira prima]|uniref:Glutathione peroxidase n=1 Tax=Candidatus Haliotispira prima TaxID=3034016 RepID=A0ABY8MKW8_9SPIO|nr:glutathione peroxidase [Candidatus Haliotispira prima]